MLRVQPVVGLVIAGMVGACGNGAVRGSRPAQGQGSAAPASAAAGAPSVDAAPPAAPTVDAAPLTIAARVQRSGQPVADATLLYGAGGAFVIGAGQHWLRVDAAGVAVETDVAATHDGLAGLDMLSVGRHLLVADEETFRRVGTPSPKLRGRLRQLAVVGAREYWIVDDDRRPRLYRIGDDGKPTRVLGSLDRERGADPGVSGGLAAFCAQPNPTSIAANGDALVVLVSTCSVARPVRVLTLDAADEIVATQVLPARVDGPGSFEPASLVASSLGVFAVHDRAFARADGDRWTLLQADGEMGYIANVAIASDGAPWVLASDTVWRVDGDALVRVDLADAAGRPMQALALAGDAATGVVILARGANGTSAQVFGERATTVAAVAALDD